MERIIFHCDCNNFYASVELLEYPSLRDKPVAVSGSEDERHGIILAKNEAAKKYNIKTAEAVWEAKLKCPQLILLPPHRRLYKQYSQIINDIYSRYSDRVEPFGIDESWLDVTGSWKLFGEAPGAVADRIRKQVYEETGLTISVGVSFNKIFAKLASDMKKPNATTVIQKTDYKNIVWTMNVNNLLFVGEKTAKQLDEIGIRTIGELAEAEPSLLKMVMGKQGPLLKKYAMGMDDSPVALIGQTEPIKSVGNGRTYTRNLLGFQDIRMAVGGLADEVATRLRAYNLYAVSIQVIIKNTELKQISRQKQLPYATHLGKDFIRAAMELICDNWDLAKPIRMLTITAQHLTDQPYIQQLNLLEEAEGMDEKRERLETAIDKIRGKYGKTVILEGGALKNDIGIAARAKPRADDEEESE